jgi:hypothetical protein
MKPVATTQFGRQERLADSGHTHQGDTLGFPGAEFFYREFQIGLPINKRKDYA